MAAADKRIQDLQKEVSELKLRTKELSDENKDLRELCNRNGIRHEDWLAARRHGRYFAQLRADHPIGSTAPASEILGAAPILRGIAINSGSLMCTALIDRSFFSACTQLTAEFPWRFGVRMMASFEEHRGTVESLEKLEGGRLASGSADATITIWDSALPDVLGST